MLIPTQSRTIRFELRSSLSYSFLFFLLFFSSVLFLVFASPCSSLLRLRAVKNRCNNSLAVELLLYRRLVWPSRVTVTNGTRRSASHFCRAAVESPWSVLVGCLLTGILMEDFPTACLRSEDNSNRGSLSHISSHITFIVLKSCSS